MSKNFQNSPSGSLMVSKVALNTHQTSNMSDSFLNEPSIDEAMFGGAKPTSTYVSNVKREFLESVSKEIR
jgi:hypothetical protein